MKYNINVLPFFDEMLDRSDMTIKVTGGCDGAVGARDAELSKAMGEPMCLITSDEFKALAQSDRGALGSTSAGCRKIRRATPPSMPRGGL